MTWLSKSPLNDAVNGYVGSAAARFHMPGHKGNMSFHGAAGSTPMVPEGLYAYDITEVGGCDNLYAPKGCIRETERHYTELFGSACSVMSAGGSTLCIQTMLALALKPGDKMICGRGCHTAAVNAMALLDLTPCWVYPDIDGKTGLARAVTAEQVREALAENPDAGAVYITSLDYYGSISDIEAISGVCREFGVPLLVDNAHGAFLRFLKPPLHPINLGAAMCCDSLHKTLPVLTGGAMLHIADERYIGDAKRCMSIFGSTSPSYIILASIDAALAELDDGFASKLEAVAEKVDGIRNLAEKRGFLIPEAVLRDPIRLTLGFSQMGYSGGEFMGLLRESGIEPEMVEESFCVLMASPYNRAGDFRRLEKFISELPAREPIPVDVTGTIRPCAVKTPREATLATLTEIPVEEAVGRVAGSIVAACPPGIPFAVPGELIDENLARCLKRYGISRLNVV